MIRIGILGCANIALRSIIPSLMDMPEYFTIAGIASRQSEKSNECAKKYKSVAYNSYSELIELNTLDAVYIPLPNSMHFEWVQKSLENGLHVLVEKSMGCNFNEVQTLNQIAKDNNLVLMENFQFIFHPQLEIIQKLLLEN